MPKIKHIALFKFHDGTPQEQIDKLFDDIMDLSESIPGIEDYVSGPNNSPEGQDHGYTHGYVMTFSDATARDLFLPHPDRERLKASMLPLVQESVVLDFEV